MSNAIRNTFRPFFLKSTRRFSELIAGMDYLIKERGFVYASCQALCQLSQPAESIGKENIPADGPVIIASNHPGTFDGFSIISQLPRDDIKIVVSGIPFFRNLPNAGKHLIYTGTDPFAQMDVIRKTIRYLDGGGALLIFPAGGSNRTRPSGRAGESLHRWSRSIEVFMRKVPRSKLVSNDHQRSLSPQYINHPFTKLFRNDHERRRIMEFMQMIRQMIRGKPIALEPAGKLFRSLDLRTDPERKAKNLSQIKPMSSLIRHMERFYPDIGYPKIWWKGV